MHYVKTYFLYLLWFYQSISLSDSQVLHLYEERKADSLYPMYNFTNGSSCAFFINLPAILEGTQQHWERIKFFFKKNTSTYIDQYEPYPWQANFGEKWFIVCDDLSDIDIIPRNLKSLNLLWSYLCQYNVLFDGLLNLPVYLCKFCFRTLIIVLTAIYHNFGY